MDKVVSRQNFFKRALEKQLDEIEVRQRQSEARRMKQIRDLGVDLTRIQRTSRDLESTGDLAPRRLGQRRGSLPALESSVTASFFMEPPRTSRSGRRYSCLGSLHLPPPDVKEELSDEAFSETETGSSKSSNTQLKSASEKVHEKNYGAAMSSSGVKQDTHKKDLGNIQEKHSRKGLSEKPGLVKSVETVPSLPRVRRGSFDSSDNKGKNSNNDGHNVTTVFIHKDSQSDSKETSLLGEDTSEAESVSIQRLMRNRGRRQSEPAVGGYFIRRLQTTDSSDAMLYPLRHSSDSEDLRRSIEAKLPSNIVEEEDEEDREGDDTNSSKEDAFGLPLNFQEKCQLSSISEHSKDGEPNTYSKSGNQSRSTTLEKDRNTNLKLSRKTDTFPGFRGRRSSDGDVLSYSHAKRLNDMNKQVWRLHESAYKAAEDRSNFDDSQNENVESMKRWRNLRGCDIPELNEPTELSELVFDRDQRDSRPSTSK